MKRVSLAEINAADTAGFVAVLGDIYEAAPWVAQAALDRRPFLTMQALHEAMIAAVRAAPAEQQLVLITGHPDVAGKAAREGSMSAHSTAEQASAGLDRISQEEFDDFQRLNAAYRKKFAMPFILCIRRHSKDSLLRQFGRRLQSGLEEEKQTALTEIFRIAALRLDQRIEATDRLNVHGRLSTHVLDTQRGRPAAGVKIELLELSQKSGPRLIATVLSNRDGRTDAPLISGRPLPIGRYELRFHVGAYFAAIAVTQSDPPFLDTVPVQFAVAEPEGHYHVPLLVTPWSYSTYRGS
jgi:2-oxo-4-hydroxy-4-carboxy-5-ureidoimidazoline decarboxylase